MPQATTGFAIPRQGELFQDILNRAEDLFRESLSGGGPRFFPGRTFAPFVPETEQALTGIARAARQGSPLLDAANQTLGRTIRGDFLRSNPAFGFLAPTARGDFLRPDSNPFSRSVFNRLIAPAVRENVNSQFIGSGRFASPANTRVLADSIANAANSFFGEQFARERANQLGAAGQLAGLFDTARQNQLNTALAAPAFSQSRFADFERLAAVGAQREALEEARLQDAIARFNFEQTLPAQRLAQLQGFVFGGPTLTSTSQPVVRNKVSDILNLGLGGLGIASGIKGLFF